MKYNKNQYNTFDEIIKIIISIFKRKEKLFILSILHFFLRVSTLYLSVIWPIYLTTRVFKIDTT